MKNILAFLLLMGFASCGSKTSNLELNSNHDTTKMVDVEKWINEMIDVDSVLINGKLKVITYKSRVVEVFGSPKNVFEIDKSNYIAYLLEEDENSIPYSVTYKDISFDGVNDNLILKKTSFGGEDIFLTTPFLELKKGVHIREVCKFFPESCKLTILGGNTWTGHIELRASKKAMFEDLRWFLVFKNELLICVELHRFF